MARLVRDELIENAVKKNGEDRDRDDENLLFPPSAIKNVLSRVTVEKILNCRCRICVALKERDLLSDPILIDAVTTEGGEFQRRLLGVLLHMGVRFATRHILSFHTRGLDIPRQESPLSSDLFEPLG
jgi:hypothetical protein